MLHTASITAAVLIHRIVVLLVIFHLTLRLSRLNAHSPYWRQKLCQTGTALWPAARASVGMVAVRWYGRCTTMACGLKQRQSCGDALASSVVMPKLYVFQNKTEG